MKFTPFNSTFVRNLQFLHYISLSIFHLIKRQPNQLSRLLWLDILLFLCYHVLATKTPLAHAIS